ncbi:MAG: glycosyltransferase, partial [Patescibacteria group bacterium]
MNEIKNKYQTQYKDYSKYIAIMISTDRGIFNEKSIVRSRMIQYARLYKELHIIVFSKNKFELINIADNSVIYSTNSFFRWNYVSDACRIGRGIIKNIIAEDPILITCQDPFETGLVGKCLADIRKNIELLIQIHTDLFSPYFTDKCIGIKNACLNKIRLFISKRTLSQADIVRVVSEKIADSLIKRGFKENEIIVKPIEVNTDAIKNEKPSFNLHEKFPQYKKIILMVSRLESEKNIDGALKAFSIVNKENPELGLIIVGSGTLAPKLKKIAYNLNIRPQIAFLGWQTDLISYYKGCDIFLLTSWYEGYGMVLKEAWATGCRIVSTDVGIAREVGARIVGHTPEDIAEGLRESLR